MSTLYNGRYADLCDLSGGLECADTAGRLSAVLNDIHGVWSDVNLYDNAVHMRVLGRSNCLILLGAGIWGTFP